MVQRRRTSLKSGERKKDRESEQSRQSLWYSRRMMKGRHSKPRHFLLEPLMPMYATFFKETLKRYSSHRIGKCHETYLGFDTAGMANDTIATVRYALEGGSVNSDENGRATLHWTAPSLLPPYLHFCATMRCRASLPRRRYLIELPKFECRERWVPPSGPSLGYLQAPLLRRTASTLCDDEQISGEPARQCRLRWYLMCSLSACLHF